MTRMMLLRMILIQLTDNLTWLRTAGLLAGPPLPGQFSVHVWRIVAHLQPSLVDKTILGSCSSPCARVLDNVDICSGLKLVSLMVRRILRLLVMRMVGMRSVPVPAVYRVY